MSEKTYLGDSVYVEVEDGRLVLTTENGSGPSNTIYLELEVYDALVRYVEGARGAWLQLLRRGSLT